MSKEETIKHLYDLLKPVQKEMFNAFFNSNNRKYVIMSSRRLGKTFLLCVLALVFAIKKPNSQIRYASVSQKAVRKMIMPIMKQIILTLPTKYRPVWNSLEGAYKLENGSMVHIAGTNGGRADDLRGTAADLCLIDEAAFVDELTYLTESVLMPQLLTVPESRLIMASSSPLSPAHEFAEYIQDAKKNGFYSSFDIHQGGYPEDVVAEFCKEAGGAESTTWRREYLNELIVDDSTAIIPEWKDSFVQDIQRDAYYNYYHKYESMDIGVRDNTAVLFAYYNFKTSQLIIENEFIISGNDTTTRNIASGIEAKEKELSWTSSSPYRRIADNNNIILLQDLGTEYNLHFGATSKDTLAAMINEVRIMVQDGRILVHPRCTNLIGSLKYGVFQDSKRKEFGRSKTFGHFDSLASLIYLVRNLDLVSNPIPITHGVSNHTHFIPNQYNSEQSQTANEIKKIFNL